jgi:hypothetical protein
MALLRNLSIVLSLGILANLGVLAASEQFAAMSKPATAQRHDTSAVTMLAADWNQQVAATAALP